MKPDKLLSILSTKKIRLYIKEGNLEYNAPKGVMDKNLLNLIKKNKQTIIKLLENNNKKTSLQSTVIERIDRHKNIFTSFSQERLLFFNQLINTSKPNQNIPWNLYFYGYIDTLLLKKILNNIIKKHESLRTTFSSNEGNNYQIIKNTININIPIIEIKRGAIKKEVKYLSKHNFNLNLGPLIKIVIFRLSEKEHILSLNLHHIVADGWSLQIILEDIKYNYSFFKKNNFFKETTLEYHYADFSNWQYQCLNNGTLNYQLNYWKQQLNGIKGSLQFPLDHPRKKPQRYLGKNVRFQLKKSTKNKLLNLCKSEGTTLFMTLLTGFYILIYRYSGEPDICIGTPIANRQRAEFNKTVGYFANTLPLRIIIKPEERINKLLQQVKNLVLLALSNQDIPFERIVELINPIRSTSYSPLFQIMFSLQNTVKQEFNFQNITSKLIETASSTAIFDLTLTVTESKNTLYADMEYNTDLFKQETIKNLLNHFNNILENLTKSPNKKLIEIKYLSEKEKYNLLTQWNNTKITYKKINFIHQLIEEKIEKIPSAIAVTDKEKSITFKELNIKSNQLANYLIRNNIHSDQRIILCIEPSLEMMIGLLAILKSGAAYIPIDINQPKKRIEFIIKNSQPHLILTNQYYKDKLFNNNKTQCVILNNSKKLFSNYSAHNPKAIVKSENLAYVIYTSGSTGAPKAVMQTHAAFFNHMQWMIKCFSFSSNDNILQKTSISFDAASWEWALALILGAKLVLAENNSHRNPDKLLKIIKREKITVFQSTPSLLSNMVNSIEKHQLPSLRYIFCGGEPLTIDLCQKIKKNYEKITLCNLYGTTETAIDNTYWIYKPKNIDIKALIGKPINNTQLYLLDNQLNPVAKGIEGEIYIAGQGIGRGYLDDPVMTAEYFLPNPFSLNLGDRIYKSRDLAKYQTDGNIELLQRSDQQINIRGARIEPAEIESIIEKVPGIKQVVVLAQATDKKSPFTQQLTAYIVHVSTYNHKELYHYLETYLPDYMIPTFIIQLNKLPLKANGKLDKKSLPLPTEFKNSSYSFLKASSNTQKKLNKIWAELLNIKTSEIGIRDNFFKLGGHSLLATKLVNKIQRHFNKKLLLQDIINTPTIEAIANIIEKKYIDTFSKIEKNQYKSTIPLSFFQRGIWFSNSRIKGHCIKYNMPREIKLIGKLHNAALKKAIQIIVNRHESLRTYFPNINGKIKQIIIKNYKIHIPSVKINNNLNKYIKNNRIHIFNLEKHPPIKFQLLQLSNRHHILLINIHHIIFDGLSMNIFDQELSALYESYVYLKPCLLPILRGQYQDFIYWQHKQSNTNTFIDHKKYWIKKLKDIPQYINIPIDRPRQKIENDIGGCEHFIISSDTSTAIQQLCKNNNCTLFSGLMAAFKVLLYRLSGNTDIFVGTVASCRQKIEFDDLIGCFVNTLVLRDNITTPPPSFVQFMNQVQTTANEALIYKGVPFEQLIECLKLKRTLGLPPLVQIFMVYQDYPIDKLNLLGLSSSTLTLPIETTKFELSMSIYKSGQGFECSLEYKKTIFNQLTIRHFITLFNLLLKSITLTPYQTIDQLTILPNLEYKKLIIDYNNTYYPKKSPLTIHQLFEQQVQYNSKAIALVYQGKNLQYKHLNALSNQMAHRLLEKHVKPEVCIGLAVERSPLMIIAMLAILKAGAAYIPIPLNYPKKRLLSIINDSMLEFLITQTSFKKYFKSCIEEKNIFYIDENTTKKPQSLQQENPNVISNINNIMYVVYTSGSTGKPKGVAITHNNILNLCTWHQRRFSINSTSKATQLTSIGFDAMALEVWPYLTAGAEVHIVPNNLYLETESFIQWLSNKKITHCFSPTPIAEKMLMTPWGEQKNSLRYLFTGGDTLRKLPNKKLPFQLINNYGPTETSVIATFCNISQQSYTTIPIGKPIDNTHIYILDNHLNPVPTGVIGELYISGLSLGRGYINSSLLTAKFFLPNPFGTLPGDRLYRSGDLAKYNHNGEIEFRGRIDQQINIRGVRIELGDIEAAILEHPAINESLVIIQEKSVNIKNILAYVTIDKSKTIKYNLTSCDQRSLTSELKYFLQDKLQYFMVPDFFIAIDKISLTVNGKIDKKKLPTPTYLLLPTEEKTTKYEDKIKVLWGKILDIPCNTLTIDDDFFNLGGNSLLATTLTSHINSTLNVNITIQDIFNYSTIKNLARAIDSYITRFKKIYKSKKILNTRTIYPNPIYPYRFGIIKQSYSQKRLFFINQEIQKNDTNYNINKIFGVTGHLNTYALIRAFYNIVKRHDSLRTTFKIQESDYVQVITEKSAYYIPIITIKKSLLPQYLKNNAQQTFNLTSGPLISIKLLQHTQKEHTIILNIHHIICDAWSINIINTELSALYHAYSHNITPQLSYPAAQYSDFCYWQQTFSQQAVSKKQLGYWKKQLENIPNTLGMLTDKPKPSTSSSRGKIVKIEFSAILTQQIKQLTLQEHCTPFMLLLTGFTILLAHYSGKNTIVVGSPVANRQQKEFENIIGLFVNTLVLKITINDNYSFKDLLVQVKKTVLEALSNQDTPFEQVVETINPQRTQYYTPLFQILFSFHSNKNQKPTFQYLKTSIIDTEITTTLFDLSINLIEENKKIICIFQYNSDIYNESTIKRMLCHYNYVLQQSLDNPLKKIKKISILNNNEKNIILNQWNKNKLLFKHCFCIHQQFEQQVKKTPFSTAAVFRGKKINYQQLNSRSNKLAHYLKKQGIATGNTVAISMERSLEQLIAILATLKSGGTYVAISPDSPHKRTEHILEDCRCSILLTQKHISNFLFISYNIPLYYVDCYVSSISHYPDHNINLSISADHLIHIIYTSGSTGKPKGVMITHRAFQNHMSWMKNTFHFCSNDIFLYKTPLTFDAAGWEWAIPITIGSKIILANENIHKDPQQVVDIIYKNAITVLQVVPSLLNIMLKDNNISALKTLRYLFSGGEPLFKNSCQLIKTISPKTIVYNLYGLTESTIDSTYQKANLHHAITPIGKPIANTQIYLLDKNINPVAIGVAGEIFIAGIGLARGYINNSALTAKLFIPNPFATNKNESRLYSTGDYARYLPDGTIDLIGRHDHQVKIRGIRIELNEIEAILITHSIIKEAAVTVRNKNKNPEIIAHIVKLKEKPINTKSIKNHLLKYLPDYMIPRDFNFIKKLPRTSNGKIDKNYLSKQTRKKEQPNKKNRPLTITEKAVSKIWLNTLSTGNIKITPDTDFFNLGGHSLLAIQTHKEIEQKLNTRINIRDIFNHPTLKEISLKIDKYKTKKEKTNHKKIKNLLPVKNIPLSHYQQRFWNTHNRQKEKHFNNIPLAFNLKGQLNIFLLKKSFQLLIKRHENLRTSFHSEKKVLSQAINNKIKWDINIIDCIEKNPHQKIIALSKKEFNLSSPPLFEITLLRLSKNEHILLFNIHHIIIDGWSINIALREISTIYNDLLNKKTPLLFPTKHYRNFLQWEKNNKKNQKKHYNYWISKLKNSETKYKFPKKTKEKNNKKHITYKTYNFIFPKKLSDKIQRFRKINSVTLFTTLISCFSLYLSKFNEKKDCCILFDDANRKQHAFNNTMGVFANTLVLRIKINNIKTSSELLKNTQLAILSATENQNIAFDSLLNIVNPKHNPGDFPLFQAAFSLHHNNNELLTLHNIKTKAIAIDNIGIKVNLVMNIIESKGYLSGKIHYNTELFSQQFIKTIHNDYLNIIKKITNTKKI